MYCLHYCEVSWLPKGLATLEEARSQPKNITLVQELLYINVHFSVDKTRLPLSANMKICQTVICSQTLGIW